ncbi:MAG TPA: Clp protease N-terminal domain-containing protein [Phycisphaerae bacterium]|nr:Clp protease N-terminal domain-containing protein [Phycisphaerae bacterium]
MGKLDYRDPEWVADKLGIDRNTVYRYLRNGTLVGLRLGRKWLISESQLAEFLASQSRRQTARRRRESVSLSRTIARLAADYTDEAREVIQAAHEAANELGHSYLGQEHLLLGVASAEGCAAAAALAKEGITVGALSEAARARVTPGDAPPSGRLRRTAPAKRAMRLAAEAAAADGCERVGSDHLIRGVLRCGAGVGYEVLTSLGMKDEPTDAT